MATHEVGRVLNKEPVQVIKETLKELQVAAGDQILKHTPVLDTVHHQVVHTVTSNINKATLGIRLLLELSRMEPLDLNQILQRDQNHGLGRIAMHLRAGQRQKKRQGSERRSDEGMTNFVRSVKRKRRRRRMPSDKHAPRQKRKSGRRCDNVRRR
jgi:hypothetical protein